MLQYHLRNPPWRHTLPPTCTGRAERASPIKTKKKNEGMMYRSLLMESLTKLVSPSDLHPPWEPHIPSTEYRSSTFVLRYFCLGRVTSGEITHFYSLWQQTPLQARKLAGPPTSFTNQVGSVKVPKSLPLVHRIVRISISRPCH